MPRTAGPLDTRDDIETKSGAGSGADASGDAVLCRMLGVWKNLLELDEISPNDNFFDLGGHSLLATRLSSEIKKIWDVDLSLAAIFEVPTPEKMAAFVCGRLIVKSSPRIAAIKAEGDRPAFLCVDAGPFFRNLTASLDPDQPFFGLRLVDTESLPTHFTMADIAAYHVQTILSLQPDGPYFLGGWSASGLVAYEVAQQLRSQGREIALLVLFDTLNPTGVQRPANNNAVGSRFQLWRWKLAYHLRNLRSVSGEKRKAYVRNAYRQWRINVSRKLWKIGHGFQGHFARRLPLVPRGPSETVFIASLGYRPAPYAGRILLFRSAIQARGPYSDPQLGWGHLLGDNWTICDMPGDHEDMFLDPMVGRLGSELSRFLVEAGEAGYSSNE